ncbi:MAG: CehA/McbA family metallohydrolase [Planctomycetota bacterium]|nr:CehA/McbA family metallohydrolase [Planctomycetota bacterium]
MAHGDELRVTGAMHHLRAGGAREWQEFPEKDPGSQLSLRFRSTRNATEHALLLRQSDVKSAWEVRLNGKRLGELMRDENEMVVGWPVAAGALRDGENELEVRARGKRTDDIRVGDVRLYPEKLEQILGQARLDVTVVDAGSGRPVPCRLTVTDDRGFLAPLGARSSRRLAVRPGVIYTADGRAEFGVPAGSYRLVAGRGFEYSIARLDVSAGRGERLTLRLEIRREVETPGLVACDPHVHTFTYSRHGDATMEERLIAIAGEGVELPIATDHDVHIDYEPLARELGLRHLFTPVIGNEVTTPVGHFNIFPIDRGAPVPSPKVKEWKEAFARIERTPGVRVVILNHPRGLHQGFRPFGPEHHIAMAGENRDGWQLEANAIELVNSGALQTDPMLLFHDWFALLNRGHRLAPVGSSDSHDVAGRFVGQGRTYILCPDGDPGKIDVARAARNLAEGRAYVSMGLLVRVAVSGEHGPGDLVRQRRGEGVRVEAEVLGPGWSRADRVALYANGALLREARIDPGPAAGDAPGRKWKGEWRLPAFSHDAHLVVIARGPGVDGLFWRIPRSYQPASTRWVPYVIAASGAVWLDGDGDGRFSSARDYATGLLRANGFRGEASGDLRALVRDLASYDAAVATQAASELRRRGVDLESAEVKGALDESPSAATRGAFASYIAQWKSRGEG